VRYQHDCDKPSQMNGARKTKTALHVGSSKGHANIVSWLLEQYPDTVQDFSPDLNRFAIHYACNFKSNVEIMDLLITKGHMDPNTASRNGWLPIHYAVAASRLDLAQFLFKKGANIHAELESGGNAITLASCSKNEELVRWLLDQGVSPNVQDKQGLTALHRLSRFGDLSMTKVLVEYGNADVHLLDKSGCSVMEEADRNNMSEIATYLWTKGCESTSIKNPDGLGPTAWFRVRHVKLPSSRYGCGLAHMGSKLILFSGLGHDVDYVNHDNENHLATDAMTQALKDTYLADLNTVEHLSMIPFGVNPLRTELSLSSVRCGKHIRLDSDGLGGWSTPCPKDERLFASIVTATKPFKREEKFGYFELHVVNGGEHRILTIGLVDDKYPMNQKQPGWERDSYGYHGDDGGCFHNNGAGKAWAERFNPGDVIGCGINFEGNGEIFWTKNGKFLGVSHIGPQADVYWPAIGVENDGAIFRVNFGKTPFQFSFVVPTLTWNRAPQQDEYACSSGRLIPLPEVDEVLAIPDRLSALSSKVWLFNMRTTKWRTHMCVGIRPTILQGSQHVRLGDAVYVWNPAATSQDGLLVGTGNRSPALYKLDLEYWSWSEVLSYNVLADSSIDDNLNPISSDSDEEDNDEEEEDSDLEDEDKKKKKKEMGAEAKAEMAKGSSAYNAFLQTVESGKLASSSDTSSIAKDSGAGSSSVSKSDAKEEEGSEGDSKTKLTPKEAMSVRMHNVVSLLDSEYKDSFMVAMGDELVFVQHMTMLRVNPRNFVYSTAELRGTRPKITHHSAIAVGTDILTFGGWDDRKQQNELFILDTKSGLWYKPHINGLLFPRPRNNHACTYFETKNPSFAVDPSDDGESSILAKHSSCLPPVPTPASRPSSKSSSNVNPISRATADSKSDKQKSDESNDDQVYRFCVIAMGWNGSNTMIDVDFVALDTQKRAEELGNMLEDGGAVAPSPASSGEISGGVDFDILLEIQQNGTTVASIGAHKAILWARSDYFKALLTTDLFPSEGAPSLSSSLSSSSHHSTFTMEDASPEHVRALLKFFYTDHVNVVALLSEYRGFVKVAEKYAPNHVQRLVAEYLHTKVYEPEKLNEELAELLTSGAFSDVTFRVKDREFKAHKVVLAARSPFFKALLTGGLKESRQEVIEIDYASPVEFEALLKFLYSKTIDYATISEYILDLFALAARTEARRLKTILESLIAFNLDASNVASLLLLADQLTAPALKRACQDFIKNDPTAVQYEDSALRTRVEELMK